MPNKNTFSIKPIRDIIEKYHNPEYVTVDPFSNGNRVVLPIITNDICDDIDSDHHMDAYDFLNSLETGSVDYMLFDPPYSPRQVSEVYKKVGRTVNMQTTQSSYWSKLKKEVSRVLKAQGICITCGWNSGGIGKSNGFEIIEVLLVPHGGWHNDTIITVERKLNYCL